MSRAHLTLYFSCASDPELVRSVFQSPDYPEPIVGVRGTLAPASQHPFRWSPLARTICIFFLRAVIFDDRQRAIIPLLEGFTGTPASMLGAVANRARENAVIHLFGSDRNGRPALLRMLTCLNYRRRRPGPIAVYYRSTFLHPDNIVIYVGEEEITHDRKKLLALDRALIDGWTAGNCMSYAREQRKRA